LYRAAWRGAGTFSLDSLGGATAPPPNRATELMQIDDPRVLAMLLGLALLLYLAAWLLIGPPPDWQQASEAVPPEATSIGGWARLEQGGALL
jgi:hypothetical protein